MRADWTDLDDALARAYFDAAKSRADMRAAANAFEAVKAACVFQDDVFDVRAAFLDQIGRADLKRLVPLLIGLQNGWERAATDAIVANIREAFARNAADGWRTWLQIYADSFDDRAWWKTFACEIAEALPSCPSPEWPPQRIRAVTRRVLRGEWVQTFDWIVFLAGQELPSSRRALFLAIAAEIEIYHFTRPAKARKFLDQAEALAPDHATVCRAWGEYCQLVQDTKGAQDRFRELVNRRPDLADGFIGLAECHDKANEPNLAETFYQQAVASAPGMYDSHYQLLKWHAKPEWFASREGLLAPLSERMLKLVDYAPGTSIELGWLYHQNRRYEDARAHFREAIALDPGCSRPHVGLGYCDLDEARGAEKDDARATLLEHARANFDRASAESPQGLEGYWGQSWIAEEERQWDDALAWCDRALQCHEGWESFARARRADLLRQSDRLEEARKELERATAEAESTAAVVSLLSLSLAFRDRDDPETALSLLERWRELMGPSGEATFHNNVGHLSYRAGNYVEAAVRYRLAVAANPQDDVLQSNLASALENSRQPGRRTEELDEAIAALESALRIKPQNAAYQARLDAEQVERRFVAAYGEAALSLDVAVTPIRAELSAEFVVAILDARQTALSAEVMQKAQMLRDDVRERYGVTLPGVQFATLQDPSRWRDYRILLMDRDEFNGFLFDEKPEREKVIDAIFRRITDTLEACLDRFILYEEAVELLRSAGHAAQEIIERPEEVVRFAEVLRSLLRIRKAITPIESVFEEFARLRDTVAEPDLIAASIAGSSGIPVVKGAPAEGRSMRL
jgi:tetratricopeptide (TPR) repeat protein